MSDNPRLGGKYVTSRVTVRDIAREAGVSVATVSRAMRGESVVLEATRLRVLAVAHALGYKENVLARDLARRKSDLVAVVVGDITNPFYPEVIEKLTRRLTLLGLHTMLVNMIEGPDVEGALSPLFKYQVKAAIFVAVSFTSQVCDVCHKYDVPVFLLNHYVDSERVTKIVCDNYKAARELAEVLVRAGHSKMIYVGGKSDTSTNRDRKAGFTDGLCDSGSLGCRIEPAGEYSYAAGYRAGLRLIRQGHNMDAIFCANDILALGVLDAVRYAGGVRVPEDVSVIGFDDIAAASWPGYDLTTVKQPVEQMLELLTWRISRIDSGPEETGDHLCLIPGELVVRSSARLTEKHTVETNRQGGSACDMV